MLDATEGQDLLVRLDQRKVATARAAFGVIQARRALDAARADDRALRGRAQATNWHEALVELARFADALAGWDDARSLADALDLLLPHAAIAQPFDLLAAYSKDWKR
jgi:hypothetical protein